ncbi:MAG: FAD-binding protein [Alphaproteobacteria bacterium]|nr:FAD-binding protein [Alphaproteobacteria bacterium]
MASSQNIMKWSDEADVVILGYGLSGAVSAVVAKDADPQADILIVEKMAESRAGGNSRVSGQTIFCANNRAALARYKMAMDEPNPLPPNVLEAWLDGVISLEPWLTDMASQVGQRYVHTNRGNANTVLVEFPEFSGSECVEFNSTIEPNPSGVWTCFRRHVERRAIRIEYQTRALELVQDPKSREILGVLVAANGESKAIRARRGVVVCTGGFENDLPMQRNLWGADRVYTLGTPGNTGDGLRILQRAGADLWHVRNCTQSGGFWPAFKVPEFESAFMRRSRLTQFSFIEVARDGRRFHNEVTPYRLRHAKQHVHGHWIDAPFPFVLPVHMIMDQAMLDGAPLVGWFSHPIGWNTLVEGYEWSADNSKEVAQGWIRKAASLSELAGVIGVDPEVLAYSVSRYNGACTSGHDAEFARPPEEMRAIAGPPFYAAEIVPGIVSTTGGGRRNHLAQVMDHGGRPIPRLYEAGELGAANPNLYQSGAFLTDCLVFGRIAGRNVAAERP